MPDDTTPGSLSTQTIEVDDTHDRLVEVKATRETETGGVRIESRLARTHGPGEFGVVLLGWTESGPTLNLTGGEWVDT
jgi:hypothetical protein